MSKDKGYPKMKNWKSLKELFSSYYRHFLKTLMAFFIRSDQECGFSAFFSLQFPDIICHKNLPFMIEKLSDKF